MASFCGGGRDQKPPRQVTARWRPSMGLGLLLTVKLAGRSHQVAESLSPNVRGASSPPDAGVVGVAPGDNVL